MLDGNDLAHFTITSCQNTNQLTSCIEHGTTTIAGQRPRISMNAGLWQHRLDRCIPRRRWDLARPPGSAFRRRLICSPVLGIAAGEIAGGIEIIGAGQGFTTPPFPAEIVDPEARGQFFYFLSFLVLVLAFIFVKYIYGSRFRLILNAIRDNEDKAEAMGIQTMKYKIVGWMVSAFFCGLAGGIMGGLIGYIDSTDVAFDGREMGVFMVLMAILGGKGTLWGPIIGATLFHFFKEGLWTFILGWQYVALGVLIVVIVIYFPEGLMGWLREKYPERFGEVVDEKDRKSQVELK